MPNYSRRQALSIGIATVSLAMSGESKNQQAVSQSILPVRKSITSLTHDDPILMALEEGIAKLKELPIGDRRNWQRLAEIHSRHCPHGNWYFLPWHRAYLSMYEALIRDITGLGDFALPYWDWTKDSQIPQPYFKNSSSLYQADRAAEQTDSANQEYVGRNVVDRVLSKHNFSLFGSAPAERQRDYTGAGALEAEPHNYIHNFVGGAMRTMMSPMDPVFLAHHANIDRLWSVWIECGQMNPTESSWTDFLFEKNFVNTSGQEYDVLVGGLSGSVNFLGYSYDPEPLSECFFGPTKGAPSTVVVASSNSEIVAEPSIPAELNVSSNGVELNPAVLALHSGEGTGSGIRLSIAARIRGIKPPPTGSVLVRVFINCDYLTTLTPTNDPHYVTSFAFFGSEHSSHDASSEQQLLVDLSPAVESLSRIEQFDAENIRVQLLSLRQEDSLASDKESTFSYNGIDLLIL